MGKRKETGGDINVNIYPQMATKKRPINQLRSFAVKTIKQPEFLIDPSSPLSVKNLVWNRVHNILYEYMVGITEILISNSRIKQTCEEIQKISDDMSNNISDNDMMYVWLFLGETVESWIEEAIELEEFECASNLKKLLENEYT
jgi:hypothetical protein